MAIITLPQAVRIKHVEWTVDQPAQVNRSKWTQRRQVVSQPGPALITATAELVVAIREANALEAEAFIIDLEGPVNSFRLGLTENPQFEEGSVAYVNGAGQSGRALNLKGGPPGQTLRRGMKFTTYDQAVFVMVDTTFAGAAVAVVVPIVVSDTQAAVAKLKQLPIATTALNLISGLASQPQAGETKLQQVVGFIKPLVSEGEDIVREFVQSLYNDFTTAAAPLILKAADELQHAA